MKKKIALITALVLVFMLVAQSVSAINVIMNSSFVEFPDQEPVVEGGVTLVPIRTIAEKLGLEILWDDPTDTVTLKKDNFYIELVIGSTTAKTSSGEQTLLTAPKIINGRTMVPLRFIAEQLGLTVSWNQEYQRVVIAGEVDTFVPEPPAEKPTEKEGTDGEKAEGDSGDTPVAEKDPATEEETTEEEIVEENTNLLTIEAPSSTVNFELPATFLPEDPDVEESFAYRSLDAFDVQHTYNWELVSRYGSYTDDDSENGILFIVQELGPYEGETYDISGMNQEFPEAPIAPERPQFPELDWEVFQYELERVLLEQVFLEKEVEVPDDLMDLEEEQVIELLGLESEEELTELIQLAMETADLSQVPGYDEYVAWQDEQGSYNEEYRIYREEYNIYREEYNQIAAVKYYAARNFSNVASQASDEDWAMLFDSLLNTDPEVRYDGVEIVDFDGKKAVHATIYAEDPDDEQGVYDYYEYHDGDTVIIIFGGTLSGGEASAEAVEALSQMIIQ